MNRYLVDSNVIIILTHPRHTDSLRHAVLSNPGTETDKWLMQMIQGGVSNGCILGCTPLFEEVQGTRARSLLDILATQQVELTEEVYQQAAEITMFVRDRFDGAHAIEFESGKDALFIATAKVHGLVLVTGEKHSVPQTNGSTGRVQGKAVIPYVAYVFGVKTVNVYQMLLDLTQPR